MATAGFSALVSIGGTSTALTNEAMTALTAGLVYQITNVAHQALDPTVQPVVQTSPDGTTWGAPSGSFSVDFTSGVVTFATSQGGSEQCRIQSGNYIPLLTIAQARKTSWKMSRDVPDATVYGAAGAHQRLPLLLDCTVTLEDLSSVRQDTTDGLYDAVHRWFDDLFLPGADVFVAFQPGGAGNQQGRGWFRVESPGEDIDVTGLVIASISLQLNSTPVVAPTGGTGSATVSWR